MARKVPRYSTPVATTASSYDIELLKELLEKFTTNVPTRERSNTTMWCLLAITDAIMGVREYNPGAGFHGEPRWNNLPSFSRNSNMGVFLSNNFPRDHRIFNYVQVWGYSLPVEQTQGITT